jgi:hypothetical protein
MFQIVICIMAYTTTGEGSLFCWALYSKQTTYRALTYMGKCGKGASNAYYSRQLLKAIGRVEELVTSDEEVRKLMLDWEAWRSRMKMIVAANKEIDSSKREDSKIRLER